jgi:pyruvate dehydrogenase E2 component (dihydrolipoamide acetyltransferase)
MANEITVPRLGWTMEEGTFGGWLKADGDNVREGDELFVLESDKASESVAALDAGILRIPGDGPRQGDVVKVGQRIGYLTAPGEAMPSGKANGPTATRQPETPKPMVAAAPPTVRRKGQAISPRARRAARALGVDWADLTSSGSTGRLIERDVLAAAGRGTADRVVPASPLRRLIAERMAESSRTTAPVTLTTKADATHFRRWRERRKAEGGPVPGYTELILSVTAKALRQHSQLNARWQGDTIVVCGGIHLGVAVDTPAGLVVPVIRDSDRLSVDQLGERLRDLAERARSRRLRAEEMEGGTFTVSNLGMYGIDAFTPIVNLPECAVLGVGRVVSKPAVWEGHIVPRDMVTLSLTFDHRAVDGAPAARFLSDVRLRIEAGDGIG